MEKDSGTAFRVINSNIPDPTGGATHYYAPAVVGEPDWANGLTPSYTHGGHIFYNDASIGVVVSSSNQWSSSVVRQIIFNQDFEEFLENWDGSCFGPEVPIDMWLLDPDLKPGPDGIYDQDEVRAKVWKKPIDLIEVGDIVVSFDDNDNLVPGPVTRTFQNDAKILLDFHGTRVTPGHVYYRSDSRKSYKYETLIDVLRDDGVIQKQDGTLIHATTPSEPRNLCHGSLERAAA